ncbi:hypothetical protein HPP92_026395 [Vanilla planifolia]|uniref:Uncharacterized protein n=1 Tax=Vanilla planifolia TaxID=51239 RepID=A0A835UAA5_VANPL|nr:hypothetical protein HPP92_026395 [Vanilla planifolia]KAG0455544.1 hypothetical protein HPP92_024836 [Vanilla planifolia]
MRVLFGKHYCPSICFSKSFLCVYSSCPLKLEDSHHGSSGSAPVHHAVEVKSSEEKIEDKDIEPSHEKVDVSLKSSLKKSSDSGKREVGKGRVNWMDFVGKELVEIKEFEPNEPGQMGGIGSVSSQPCLCVIQ